MHQVPLACMAVFAGEPRTRALRSGAEDSTNWAIAALTAQGMSSLRIIASAGITLLPTIMGTELTVWSTTEGMLSCMFLKIIKIY